MCSIKRLDLCASSRLCIQALLKCTSDDQREGVPICCSAKVDDGHPNKKSGSSSVMDNCLHGKEPKQQHVQNGWLGSPRWGPCDSSGGRAELQSGTREGSRRGLAHFRFSCLTLWCYKPDFMTNLLTTAKYRTILLIATFTVSVTEQIIASKCQTRISKISP